MLTVDENAKYDFIQSMVYDPLDRATVTITKRDGSTAEFEMYVREFNADFGNVADLNEEVFSITLVGK
jgi:hypothetical protein